MTKPPAAGTRAPQASSPMVHRSRCNAGARVRSPPRRGRPRARPSPVCHSLSSLRCAGGGGRSRIPFPLARPRPAYCRLGGEHPQLADPQINARFENRRIERHAQSLRRRRRNVGHFRSMPRMPATTRGDQRKWRAGACPADRLRQQPPFRGVPLQLRAVGGREVH